MVAMNKFVAFASFLVVCAFSVVAHSEKCEKDWLEIYLQCGEGLGQNDLFVVTTSGYMYTNAKEKKKDDYMMPGYHSAIICGGAQRSRLGFHIVNDACDATDITSRVSYYHLTKAEIDAEAARPGNKHRNHLDLAKHLKKPAMLVVPLGYEFDANKEGKNVIEFVPSTRSTRRVPRY
ncbi:MAG: hypothetical protein RJA70_3117 [Pseudomonadota bacterium]|jgi:hypothetical protein